MPYQLRPADEPPPRRAPDGGTVAATSRRTTGLGGKGNTPEPDTTVDGGWARAMCTVRRHPTGVQPRCKSIGRSIPIAPILPSSLERTRGVRPILDDLPRRHGRSCTVRPNDARPEAWLRPVAWLGSIIRLTHRGRFSSRKTCFGSRCVVVTQHGRSRRKASGDAQLL
jgi:hypothetical protein